MSSDDLGRLGTAPSLSTAMPDARPQLDTQAPGERYYRHPGDVVRLVVWGCATVLLAVLVSVATATTDGVTSDLGQVAARVSRALRELSLALLQVGAIAVPIAVAVLLVWLQRWRRLGFLLLAGLAGAAAVRLLDILIDLGGRAPGAITSGTWVASTRFPSLEYLGGVAAAVAVGKPWLSCAWRRAGDVSVACLVLVMGFAGTAGVPALLLAVAAGVMVGAALLVGFGAPNRRPSPDAVGSALRGGGLDVATLDLVRAEGGRSQLYVATVDGDRAFVKVYGRDSRDADLLYRGYRHLALRGINDEWPSLSLEHDVDHEAFLLLWARQGGVACPGVEAVASLPDGSIALALEYVDGAPLDALPIEEIDDQLLDATWAQVRALHARRLAHRALRAGNILVTAGGPVIIDLGFGMESATPRMQAIDRAELLTSLATLVGPERALASAARVIDPEALANAAPFIQPLALSSATRGRSSKVLLKELRDGVADATGREPPPMERLVRVRPRLLLMIAVLVGAFYLLLPQLAHVGDSFTALRSASWPWLLVCVVMSLVTYFASALGNAGGVIDPIPVGPNIEAQFASSFVNRVSPANVGGMALNVRFLRKAGIEPAAAVTGVGLNALVGGIVHVVLLVVFFAWAGQSGAGSFKIPSSSKLLVAIAVVFALVGIVSATRKGRRVIRTQVWGFMKRSAASLAALAQSPVRLAQLFGGSIGVTLAYIGALAAAVAAFHGGISVAQVGAVYLGASIIAAAAPSPGGLGALEAAVVAGLTGVHMEPGAAVAAVLSYRLLTYWLPILPGWLAFHDLERKGQI